MSYRAYGGNKRIRQKKEEAGDSGGGFVALTLVDEVAPIKKAPYGVEGRFIQM